MSLFSKKKKDVSDEAKSDVKDLEVELRVKIRTGGDYSNKTIAEITINKALISNSDTLSKELLKEVESVLGGVYEDTEDQVKNSRYLSEGYHKEKKEAEEKEGF